MPTVLHLAFHIHYDLEFGVRYYTQNRFLLLRGCVTLYYVKYLIIHSNPVSNFHIWGISNLVLLQWVSSLVHVRGHTSTVPFVISANSGSRGQGRHLRTQGL